MKTRTLALKNNSYAALKAAVQKAILEGRERAERAVEQEKIRTYWKIGRLLEAHVLQHKDRADYGEKVIRRLAKDLRIPRTQLYYSLEFARAYPIVPARGQLTWTHHKRLLSINNRAERKALAAQAEKASWGSRELEAKLKEIKLGQAVDGRDATFGAAAKKFIPRRGLLRTYQLVAGQNLQGEKKLFLDRGFRSFTEISPRDEQRFRAGSLVEARGQSGWKPRLRKARKATRKDLFTYAASVETVLDGDTFWLWVELGLGGFYRDKLRLRGIDTPELKTRAGERAKKFVEEELREAPRVVVTTTKPEKFGRFLTDLFYLKGESDPEKILAQGLCLNQELLHRGLARPL
jgi:endonuclease YncB( thermonuclease family)